MKQIMVDTNIILYTYDYRDQKRMNKATEIIKLLENNKKGVISVQTLSEFMNVVTRGQKPLIESKYLLTQLQHWISLLFIIPLNQNIVLEATRCVKEHKLSYYDAQIWATAKLNQIPVIFSEDFQNGQILEGVRFVNPFLETFDIEQWR